MDNLVKDRRPEIGELWYTDEFDFRVDFVDDDDVYAARFESHPTNEIVYGTLMRVPHDVWQRKMSEEKARVRKTI